MGLPLENDLREIIDRLAHRLRPHYNGFLRHREAEVLLTAHSHQAWPDTAREAQLAAWDDAARLVDGKWDRIFSEIIPEYQTLTAERLGSSRPQDLAIAPNTHELVYRLLSCFPPNATVITTSGEFHSVARQLRRLQEAELDVQLIDTEPQENFLDRFIDAIDSCQARAQVHLVITSLVFYTTGRVFDRLNALIEHTTRYNIPVLVDAYHAYNAMPLHADAWGPNTFVIGGGYKYAQSGEGCCFMLLPPDSQRFRPRQTGWFADFAALEGPPSELVGYGPHGQRFMGATFEVSPYYRAVFVMRWMANLGLTPDALREASLARTQLIIDMYDRLALHEHDLHLMTPRPAHQRGGFVALRSPRAQALSRGLRARGIHTDARGEILRLGPAPYTTADEIERALETLATLLNL